ncbi:MAG: hypothetical protein JXJ04_18950 [Spirochaetales bacterium]|nr:hypothetical protein [Spirochaetales bacterium]
MSMLFNDENSGYRLDQFEFYNWGSFDNKIWKITPKGKSSLLTGANGSGKTTVVDALVTLLVPPFKRHYNQSSGADKKRERTEASYVLGAIGSRRNEDMTSAVAEFLREKTVSSVLLGKFVNENLHQVLTLGQVRWFSSTGLNRLYFSTPQLLSLQDDLLPIDFSANFRKYWKERFNITFYESFSLYSRYFIPILGLKSEKGLNLFSHIVGVKVLGNLNEFIRNNMLDSPDMEDAFKKLFTNYQQLFDAHQKIALAEKQLELLEPVIKSIVKFESAEQKSADLRELKRLLPGYFASVIHTSLKQEIARKEDELSMGNEKKEDLEKEREAGERERRSLQAAIDRNDTARRIKDIEDQLSRLEENKNRKHQSYTRYAGLCESLGLHKLTKEEDFLWNREKGKEREGRVIEKQGVLDNRIFKVRNEIQTLNQEKESLERDIESLLHRKNNIPRINIEIRERIAHALELNVEDLPFAGELVRVKETELHWELAAERLLHNFALCVLVGEEHYGKVNRFVNKNNLKGRLVYFKVAREIDWSHEQELAAGSLIYKLEIKKDSYFFGWIENYLHNHFDYICVDKVNDLVHYKQAVTCEGLIKSRDRHEKDDRRVDTGRKYYVLGWDNREKIAFLTKKVRELKNEIDEKSDIYSKFEVQRTLLEKEKADITRFMDFQFFHELNWWDEEAKIKELGEQRKKLLSESKELKELQQHLDIIEEKIKKLSEEISSVDRYIGKLVTLIDVLQNDSADYALVLESFEGVEFDKKTFVPVLGTIMDKVESLSLDELKNAHKQGLQKAETALKNAEELVHEYEKRMIRHMDRFKSPGGDILKKYPGWESITINLHPDRDSREDFHRVHTVIKKDDLPKYKRNFKEFLNEKMIEDLVDFKQSLENGERDILNSIEELNSALKDIQYNKSPPTYIILHNEPTRDKMIIQFRAHLKNILGDARPMANRDEAALENLFLRMQKFILEIREDSVVRKKVLDVRNWQRFSVIEKFSEDHTEKQYYEDSQSLSGGEKAKLAYTILASAIAYQFNISGTGDTDRSFRFAIVDEAFSKVDPDNSIYAMDLFKKLKLQLMVVTPDDKINIVENYIHSVHFVSNNGRTSSLYNLTIEEYEEKKKEFPQGNKVTIEQGHYQPL